MRLLRPSRLFPFVAGFVTAYLFDPDRGRARRAQLWDQGRARGRHLARTGSARLRDERNRIRGRVIEATKPPTAPADDVELAQRVRSEVLGRREFRDLPITVDAAGGVVHLRGMVDDRERASEAIGLIREIPGVARVDNLLHDHLHPAPNKEAALRAP